jgi:hypothetical protein
MGISGYEAFVMSTISPFVLSVPSVRSSIVQNTRVVHLLSLTGLMAFLVTHPELRLLSVGFGVSMSCLAWSASWYAERGNPIRLRNKISAWCIGLIASSIAKFAFKTNNPIWPIMHAENGGWNKLGLFLAVLAILRSTRRVVGSGSELAVSGKAKGSVMASAFGLAGLFFAMHSLLSDSSTMVLWVWEGHPVRGPIAVHGILTITAMSIGLCLGNLYPDAVPMRTRYMQTAVGAFLLTCFSHWLGFMGALLLACFTMSLAPSIIATAATLNPGAVFGLGYLIYNILVLAHVWIVAYAFVPGGPIMREHTDWVMTATVLFIGAGVLASSATESTKKPKSKARNYIRSQGSYQVYLLAVLELLAISIAYLRFPTNDYTPYHKDDKVLTAGIWTVHFSLDNDMWSSEHRMRDVIKELEIDVIGLLESDLQRIIMGNRDTTQFLAEDLGMYVDYGPGPNKHTWGAALLSKFPIVNSTHHLLPSPVGELAPAIHATLDAYGELVDVFVFHSGQEEDPEDRRLQSLYLAQLMKESPRPTILLSYLVTKPLEGNYHTYVGEKSGMKDIDASDWDRWCEYILFKGVKRTGYARVSRSTITDTEIQVSFLRVMLLFMCVSC